MKFTREDPAMAGFIDNLDRINGVAERSKGFIWRLQDETGNATELDTPWSDSFIVNMSVWESAQTLEHFVWNTVHKKIYERKNEWFDAMKSHHFVMWWIEEGYQPTLLEAKERLEYLDKHGNSDHAFNWAHLPHVKLWQPHVKLWQKQQCG